MYVYVLFGSRCKGAVNGHQQTRTPSTGHPSTLRYSCCLPVTCSDRSRNPKANIFSGMLFRCTVHAGSFVAGNVGKKNWAPRTSFLCLASSRGLRCLPGCSASARACQRLVHKSPTPARNEDMGLHGRSRCAQVCFDSLLQNPTQARPDGEAVSKNSASRSN